MTAILETPDFRLAPANCANIYLGPQVRISLLTEQMVRFEYAEDGGFADHQTLAVINRDLGPVPYTQSRRNGRIILETAKLRIIFKPDGKPLSRNNLRVEFLLNQRKQVWFPGKADGGNLKGTARTLDCCDGRWVQGLDKNGKVIKDHPVPLCDGFVSRSGWTVVDDHDSVLICNENGRKWLKPRSEKDYQDFYLLAYGHDYKLALADAARVFGAQPLLPRYALGYWYSRYWPYADADFEELLVEMEREGAPIDVVVVDMDWHLPGWTGYTWDKRYFPDSEDFLNEMHRRGCRVTLNLHPADGVGAHEAAFPEMAAALGGADKCLVEGKIPFQVTDPEYMQNYFRLLHHPQEQRGVDFWWIDWQQGQKTQVRYLDPLPWLNHLHWEDMQKQGKRPLIFSRFGGVGGGRYAIGFSGDTISNWASLAFQPYFTATAANVLFGTWSHDIGGHLPGHISPELYLRWLQFGAWSPILRTHTTKSLLAERRLAAFPAPYRELMVQQLRERYEFVPYIYSEMRRTVDTGVSLLYPLYYDWPEEKNAYTEKQSYLFGQAFLVSPVVTPVSRNTGQTKKKIWLPPGEWFDVAHGQCLAGNQFHELEFLPEEVPVFARSGALVPGQCQVSHLTEKSYSRLLLNVYPGNSGKYEMFEDDGLTPNYLQKNNSAILAFSHEKIGNDRMVRIQHLSGEFPGFLRERQVEYRFRGVVPPQEVRFNAKKIPCVYRFAEDNATDAWRYDAKNATLIVRIARISLDADAVLHVNYSVADEFSPARGLRGLFRRLALVAHIANAFAEDASYEQTNPGRDIQEIAYAWNRIARNPKIFNDEMTKLRNALPALSECLEKLIAKKTLKNNRDVKQKISAARHIVNGFL